MQSLLKPQCPYHTINRLHDLCIKPPSTCSLAMAQMLRLKGFISLCSALSTNTRTSRHSMNYSIMVVKSISVIQVLIINTPLWLGFTILSNTQAQSVENKWGQGCIHALLPYSQEARHNSPHHLHHSVQKLMADRQRTCLAHWAVSYSSSCCSLASSFFLLM